MNEYTHMMDEKGGFRINFVSGHGHARIYISWYNGSQQVYLPEEDIKKIIKVLEKSLPDAET